MGIGYRIKEARKKIGLTQTELGEKIGVTGSAITNYENNISHPKEDILYKLFEVLEVDPNYLFQDEMPTKTKGKVLSLKENTLLNQYNKLNDIGQRKTEAYIDDLLAVPLYRKHSASDEDLKLVAETPVSIKPKINDEPEHT